VIDDFDSLLASHGLAQDSAVTLEVLYKIVGKQFLKDTEGMVSQISTNYCSSFDVDVVYVPHAVEEMG
jgi:hypothetical protein